MAGGDLKLTAQEKKEIETLFKSGLTRASKDPRKYWEMERDRHDRTKPFSGFNKAKKK
jgi:hypothetical protein